MANVPTHRQRMVHQRTLYQIPMNETIVDWATSYLHVQGQKIKKNSQLHYGQ